MSTFTNVLQQKMNNLQAQIRYLREQNVQLRNKARRLMEAAPESPSQPLGPSREPLAPPPSQYDDYFPPQGVDNSLIYMPSGPWENDPLFRWSQYQQIFNDLNLYFWWLNTRVEYYENHGVWPPVGYPPIGRYYSQN